ncbi:oxidoreductase [Herbaspirillum sp. AP02]|uniref:PDR/VanB family oxidoreductase n=1 Tax=unclassified Herbaspirillum TaxID=2624150 RepID=UPI0015D9BBCD|nr:MULTISPECIES: PDR/VanB family oxidoreductase [unclassified Herbaspirillum]MBG7622119.1 oxidoreductase [Herbaspirillum sp. AP02]NZD69138.1 oxidoreductase [Herbaspirillum sp. AP21]
MKLDVGSNLWMTMTVSAKVLEADGIYSFKFRVASGEALPRFTAGSHIDVEVAPNLIRQYSLCNVAGQESEYEIAVLLTEPSRGGSRGMHAIEVGQSIRISAPRNNFNLVPSTGRSILVAGGVGITPILSMAEELHAQSRAFELHFSARSPTRAAFRQRLAERSFAKDVRFYFDNEGQKLDLADIARSRQPDDHLYVCGPTGFMDFVLGESERLGWKKEQLHKEYFSPPSVEEKSGASFDVKIASTGDVFHIPEDKSVVQVLAENGIEIPTSCEQGICGTCITRVLSGSIDHRDFILSDEEKRRMDQFTPCCSRAACQVIELDL